MKKKKIQEHLSAAQRLGNHYPGDQLKNYSDDIQQLKIMRANLVEQEALITSYNQESAGKFSRSQSSTIKLVDRYIQALMTQRQLCQTQIEQHTEQFFKRLEESLQLKPLENLDRVDDIQLRFYEEMELELFQGLAEEERHNLK